VTISGNSLTIDFTPPIVGIKIPQNQIAVGLFETADVSVEVINAQGKPIATDRDRDVDLISSSSNGELEQAKLTIKPGEDRAITRFFPTWPGTMTVTANSLELQDCFCQVTVSTPVLLLVLCAIGGILGGFVAFWTEEKASHTRVAIGLITGFVLYWALLFGLVHFTHFSHAAVLNPLSAVMIPLLGGWGGTKILSLLLRSTGLRL
jgi:hypothetical protein